MKKVITAGKNKGKEHIDVYGYEDCTVEEKVDKNGVSHIILRYADGKLALATNKKATFEETVRDFLYTRREAGDKEEQLQLALDKIRKLF